MVSKRLKLLVCGLAAVFYATAAQSITLRLEHTGAPDHHYNKISEIFAQKVAEKSNGDIKIQIYPADQLGPQAEAVQGVLLGTHQIVLTSDSQLSNWVPESGLLSLPYLFTSSDEYVKVLNEGESGKLLNSKVEAKGATVLAWWENGMRDVTNSRSPIKTPADLKGLAIRVPESAVSIATFKALGANPVGIAFGELYTALQLHTVDGQENPPAHILHQKFYEVQKYASLTEHQHIGSPLLMNKALFEKLPPEQQKILRDTARELAPEHVKMVADLEASQWKELKGLGMQINEVDKAPFIEAALPVRDEVAKSDSEKNFIKVLEADLKTIR